MQGMGGGPLDILLNLEPLPPLLSKNHQLSTPSAQQILFLGSSSNPEGGGRGGVSQQPSSQPFYSLSASWTPPSGVVKRRPERPEVFTPI